MAVKKKSLGSAVKTSKAAPAKGGGKGKDWFGTGWASAKAGVARHDREVQDRTNEPRVFWLTYHDDEDPDNGGKPKNEATIIFVDGEPYTLEVHDISPDGNWKNKRLKTCLGKNCPFCATDNRKDFVGVFTIIDTRKYVVKKGKNKGKVYQNEQRLFVAKSHTLKQLSKIAEKRGSDLAGSIIEVTRASEKSPRSGDGFTFVKRIKLNDPAVLKRLNAKTAPKPLDYEKIFAPMDLAAAKAWISSSASAADDAGDTGDDEDVPF